MKKLFVLSGASWLLFSMACDSSDPLALDGGVNRDAQSGSGGMVASGGTLGGGSGGNLAGGAIGKGGSQASGGWIGTGGGVAMGGNAGGTTGVGGASGKVCGGFAGFSCPKEQFCEYALGECSSIADATGICMPLPQACPEIYQPVCGCNGKTYSNDCERRSFGISKRADGACHTTGKMCGGIAGFACSKGQFCDLAVGDCGTIADGAGTCALTGKEMACPLLYQPVCGCNGKTYGNDCERRAAGVSKQAEGACPSANGQCGGMTNIACSKGQFCDYPLGECSSIADGPGVCTALPEACTMIYQPVCGCDGKTYGNDCVRKAAGVSKVADGPCETTGKMCGGIAGFACSKNQFCDLTVGDCGTIADGAGTCTATGPGIACTKIYRPVCGCDGKTYGNDCERQVAGVSKQAEGACTPIGKLCGGIAGFACSSGQFCDLTPGDCGTIADGAGTCALTGTEMACPAVYLPVCGCDGKTYGNDCERQAAGISKSHNGVCSQVDGKR